MAELILHDPDGWHPGEREVAEVLQRELPNDWLLVAHLMVPDRRDDRELDLIVVGDGYVHNVEVKHATGRIQIDMNYMRSGGGITRRSPLRQAGSAAKVLRSFLDARIEGFKDLKGWPVTSRVVFSHPEAQLVQVAADVQHRVSTADTVARDLLRTDRGSSQVASLRGQLRRVLAGATLRDTTPTELQSFRVLERLESRRSCLSFRCQHFADGSVWIVRLLQPKPTHDREVAARELEALLTEYNALASLAPLGVGPRVELPQRLDTDQVLVAIAEPEGQSLLDLIEQGHVPQEQEIRRVVHEAFRTLSVVHERGHLHRAITPERVVVKPDGGVLLTDFHVAHVDGRTGLSSVLADLDPVDDDQRRWRARETKDSIVSSVEASDVYSLATTLKAWVIGSTKSDDLRKNTLVRHGDARQRLGSSCADFVEMLRAARADSYIERPRAAEISDQWSPAALASRPDDAADQSRGQPIVPLCYRELAPGDRIDERFVFRRRLGAGATAVTVLAYDEQSEREVVLKGFDFDRVPPELAKQEFAALLELNHDRIAVVRDRYRPQHPYHLVIDYAPGSPVADRLEDFIGDAAAVGSIARALLEGLAYLHGRRVIHRDISAGNVMLGAAEPEELKIIDFGLATLGAEVAGSVGTPLYRAPEVEAGGEWTPACDTYSAGVLLYQLLTGDVPYLVGNGLVKAQPVELPTSLPPEARQLAELLLAATAFDEDNRFPDAAEFLDAVEDLLANPATDEMETSPPPYAGVASEDPEPWVEDEAGLAEESRDEPREDDDAFEAPDWFESLTVPERYEAHVEVGDQGELVTQELEEAPSNYAEQVNEWSQVPPVPRPSTDDTFDAIMAALRDGDSTSTTVEAGQARNADASFRPARGVAMYAGNAWLAPGRLRRYRVGLDRTVRAVVLLAGTERQVQADPIPELVEAVNRAKRAGGQSDGGSFVINEYGHVLVPTGRGAFCVGALDGVPTFRQGEHVLTPEPDGLQPGDMWTGLLAGVRYRLKAGGNDIEYERADGRLVRLSEAIGTSTASSTASSFARIKSGGGRLYVNEAGVVTSPMQRGRTWVDVFVGRIDRERWFPAPEVA